MVDDLISNRNQNKIKYLSIVLTKNLICMKKHRANEQGIFGYENKKRTQQKLE